VDVDAAIPPHQSSGHATIDIARFTNRQSATISGCKIVSSFERAPVNAYIPTRNDLAIFFVVGPVRNVTARTPDRLVCAPRRSVRPNDGPPLSGLEKLTTKTRRSCCHGRYAPGNKLFEPNERGPWAGRTDKPTDRPRASEMKPWTRYNDDISPRFLQENLI